MMPSSYTFQAPESSRNLPTVQFPIDLLPGSVPVFKRSRIKPLQQTPTGLQTLIEHGDLGERLVQE